MMEKKFGIIGAVILALLVFGCTTGQPTGNAVLATESSGSAGSLDVITIPLSEITETAGFYEYESNGATVTFFVIKASDGSIKTAFDACDVCFSQHKGYRQEGTNMVCNNCGNKYPIVSLGTENKAGGGCWPGYLPSEIVGDNLVIKKSDLENGRNRFA